MQATVTPPETLVDAVDEEYLAFRWRPSGVFRSGTIQPLSTPVPKQDVRTRVTYQGIVRLTGEEGPVNVFLPGGNYVVKEQPFVDEISVSLAAVPDEQRLDGIKPGTLLGWAVIQRDSLLHPRASDVTECINARLYVDETPVEREIFDATRDGGVLLVPILGEHIGTTQTLTLRLWVGGGPAKTMTYTEAAFDITLSVEDADDSLKITVGDQTKQVRDASQTPQVDLTRFIETFERSEFEGQTKADHPDDAFTVESYDPLHIHPKRMVLLYFTDK
jgi:hypothetical protein